MVVVYLCMFLMSFLYLSSLHLLLLWKSLLYLFCLLILKFTYILFTVPQVLYVIFLIIFVLTFSLLMLVISLILGDFNIPVNFDNHSHPLYSNLCSISSLFSLSQVAVGPTNVPHDCSTSTIDLVFVPDTSLVNSCSTNHKLSNSDHYRIVMELNKAAKAKGRLIWRYSYADWNTAC